MTLLFCSLAPFSALLLINNRYFIRFLWTHSENLDRTFLTYILMWDLFLTVLAALCLAGTYAMGRLLLWRFPLVRASTVRASYCIGAGFGLLMTSFALAGVLVGIHRLYVVFVALVGLASLPVLLSPASLIDRADQALYSAKHHGRNRVEMWNVTMHGADLTH